MGRRYLGLSAATAAACGVLVVCGVVFALVTSRAVDPGSSFWFAATLATVSVAISAAGFAAFRSSGGTVRNLLVTPFSIAALTWVPLFVLRPFELYVTPDAAALGLAKLGFGPHDLTRTAALGGLGVCGWCIGYLVALESRERVRPLGVAQRRPFALSAVGALLVVAVGTALWVALFLRQGGPSALLESAVSIRRQQFASFYGFFGVWMVQGAALYALLVHLQTPSRIARFTLAVSVPLALASAVALQLRLLAAIFLIAAGALYVANRRLSRGRIAALAAVAVVGALSFGVFQQVREYSHRTATGEALLLAVKTTPRAMYGSDLGTYDHFVAIQQLVPSSLPHLDGETISDIPVALVPRSFWPDKPRGVDFLVSGYLYPGADAGIPISLQGELYWNGGPAAVVLGSLVLGLLLGLLTRFGLRAPRGSALFLLYAVSFPFTYPFLTRSLAVMTENLVFALVGCAIAIGGMAAHRPKLDSEGFHSAFREFEQDRPRS